ncbi:MAG: hypothetical protein ACI8RZ_000356 [Myxococcota bacterium]|jgi:hypothetical protein
MLWMLLSVAQADEGMWTPEQVPAMAETLTEMGLTVDPASLSNPLTEPLNAIVSLGFCSASFVSPDGLIATNYHCVGGYLQYNSSGEANLARDGYTATSQAGELSVGPSGRIYVLERIDDVTDRVQSRLKRRMSDAVRKEAISLVRKEIIAECEATPGYRCRVADFYEGLSYRLIVSRELSDIRLVYAPPNSVGSYGGDIDNWMWPRHTGDFALLRAYVAPDGSAAPYSEDNVPYQPAHHLPLATEGVSPGEFVMVAGFPGRTRRHDRASELRYSAEVSIPEKLALYTELGVMLREHAADNADAAARLTSPINTLANSEKNSTELLALLSSGTLLVDKDAADAELTAWVQDDRKRSRAYGKALEELESVIAQSQTHQERTGQVGRLMWIPDLLGTAHYAYRLSVEREKPDIEREEGYQGRDLERARARSARLERTLYLPADRDAMAILLRNHAAQPLELQVAPLTAWIADHGGLEGSLNTLYTTPALAETEARLALLDMDQAALEASTDPWVSLAVVLEGWLSEQRATSDQLSGAMARLRPMYMQALVDMRGEAGLYPDANSTLRLTFGHVEGWSPEDGAVFLPQTTLSGMVAKATGEFPFDAPEVLLSRAGEETRWIDTTLGDVPVNYLSTLDITGGNSGSATLNAAGEFVGLAFDGNVDSIGADWTFGPTSRTIHVDVRYMLWVMEADPSAAWLLDELGVE